VSPQLQVLGKFGKSGKFVGYLHVCLVFFESFDDVHKLEAQYFPYSIQTGLGISCPGLINV
jgi:hypothetical protein